MKKPNLRTDYLESLELHLRNYPNAKMERNFRKHVNRVKRTKWANVYLTTGSQPKGKTPTHPAFCDFQDMGFEIRGAHCPAVVYGYATLIKAITELHNEFLVAEKNGKSTPRKSGGAF